MSKQEKLILDRWPFEQVINDDKLMGKVWKTLSLPQQTVLKVFYGLDLPTDAEKALWAILNDECEHDELGYITSVNPIEYVPKEYSTLVGLMGRRSGKSSHITGFAALYEIIFGGHMRFVAEGQKVIVPYFATDLVTAKENMNHIKLLAMQQDKLVKQIDFDAPQDEIKFANGITVEARAAHVKAGRGWPIPLAILDEAGFWYTKTDSANPDYEVERAVSPSMTQFEPYAKLFIISTPYIEDGMLWDYWNAGTDGRKLIDEDEREEFEDALVVWAPTAAMANPTVNLDSKGRPTRKKLEKKYRKDKEAFQREYLARFTKAIGGLIPTDLLDKAIDKGVKERKREEIEKEGLVPYYVAVMDPGFRHDSWSFTIGHRDNEGKIIQDVLKVWTPDAKFKIALNPNEVLDEIAFECRRWNVNSVHSDQGSFDALAQLALQKGLSLIYAPWTSQNKVDVFRSLLHVLKNETIRLLDWPIQRTQLAQLQKKYTALNKLQISAPTGKHDDVAFAVAMLVNAAQQMTPGIKIEKKPMSHLEQVIMKRQNLQREMEFGEQWN